MQRTSMGQAGPDYDNLRFTHHTVSEEGDEEGIDPFGHHVITAYHPEHGQVGKVSYADMEHEPWTGLPERALHINMLRVHPDHRRRGVASQLMKHVEDMHPDVPIDHGTRTRMGEQWGRSMYGRESKPGRATMWDDQERKEVPIHYVADWTLNGKPWNLNTKKFMRPNVKKGSIPKEAEINVPHSRSELINHAEGRQNLYRPDGEFHGPALCAGHALQDEAEHRTTFADLGVHLEGDERPAERDWHQVGQGQCGTCTRHQNEWLSRLPGQFRAPLDGPRMSPESRPRYNPMHPQRQVPFDPKMFRGLDHRQSSAHALPEGMQIDYRPGGEIREGGPVNFFTTTREHVLTAHIPHPEWPDKPEVRKEIGKLHLDPREDRGGHRVSYIGVNSEYRRRGIGTALWEHAQKLGLEPRHEDMGVQTPDGHAWAQTTPEHPKDHGEQLSMFGVRGRPGPLSFEHTQRDTGGSKWPHLNTLRAYKPDEDYHAGELTYYTHPRRKTIFVDGLMVGSEHQRQGIGSALMDEMQRRHPDHAINHGDRTDDGKAWWNGYTDGRSVNRGRVSKLDLHQVRVLNPTSGYDPDLFDGEKLKHSVRSDLLHRWTLFCARNDLRNWHSYVSLYFTGGEASQWSGPGSNPNGDFDMQVGLDFDEFRAVNTSWHGLSDEEVSSKLNGLFWDHLNDHDFHPGGTPRTFDLTWYSNPAVNPDITKIHPYAAYNLLTDQWAVHPKSYKQAPHLPSGVRKALQGAETYARQVLALPEPQRTREAASLFELWHTDRSKAFEPGGQGVFDYANLRMKALEATGTWQALQDAANSIEKTAATSGFSEGNRFAERFDNEEGLRNSFGDNYRDYTAPTGHTYRLLHDMASFTQDTVTAHQRMSNGKYRGVGYLSWFGGKPEYNGRNTDGGVIYKAHVSAPHRRRGLASAMLDFARERKPEQDIRHSDALSEDGRAWAEKKASIQMMKPSELEPYEGRDDLDAPHMKHKLDDLRNSIMQNGYVHGWGDDIRLGHDGEKPVVTNGNKRLKVMRDLGYDWPIPVRTSTLALEHRHWGRGLNSLFPIDEDGPHHTATTPWRAAGQNKDLHIYDRDIVARSITHPHEFPIEEVDPRELRATQPQVTRDGVKHYMEGGEGTYGEHNNGDRRLGNDMPRIYHRDDGQKIILAGHHRAAAALLKGEPLKAMVIHGGWGAPRRAAV